ncbi:MAG: proton-conducting transporter membrane subunit, partial [Pseudomonadota bacterium]
MPDLFPPFLIFIFGAALLPVIKNTTLRAIISLVVPLVSAWIIWQLPHGLHGQATIAGLELTLLRVDKLSVVFGLIFSLAGFLSLLYAWHVRDLVQQGASLLYAGSAIGAVFAGDLVTLFFFWEGTAITSVFLIWARKTEGAFHTGMRYLVVQITSGVVLLGGVALLYHQTGSIAFDAMTLGSAA